MAKRYAICVGINTYAHDPDADLAYARPDAEDVAKILRDPTRGNFDRVSELLDEQATKDSIRKAVDDLLQDPQRRQDDLILIYFAGHGVRDKQGDLCLVPHDFFRHPNGELAFPSTLHAKELEISINNSPVKNIILLIDSCHSGALGRILGDISGKEGLNLFVIGAARSSEVALEDKAIQHGIFTECLLRALSLPPDREEWISLAQVVSFITEELKKFPTVQLFEATSHFLNFNLPVSRNPSYSVESEAFTRQVQHTFELANYTIHPAPGWCNYPNLFIAEMRAGFRSTFSAILCLNNKDKRVVVGRSHLDLFLSLTRHLRNDGDIGDGMLVTAESLVNQLRRRVEETGYANCSIHNDLVRRVIDLDGYMLRLIEEFDKYDAERSNEPPLADYYIELEVKYRDEKKHERQALAEDYVENWLSEKNRGQKLALLGEYGTGKTTVSRKVARDLAQKHLQSRGKTKQRIPVLIPLREFPRGQADIEIFIAGHLARRCNVNNPSFEAFKTMNDSGLLLLILDGFDEMAVHVDEDIIQTNLARIEQLASSPNSKVLLTSRPEYFLTAREESEALRPSRLFAKHGEYERIDLLPFNEEHVMAFLEKKVPLIKNATHGWRYYYDAIKRIHDLTDLSQRPVMLEMIIKTLPELLANDVVVDRPTLYQTYLEGEISRQVIEKRRELLIKRSDRFRMMQTLALHLYMENAPGLTAELVQILVYDEFSPKQREELEAHTRDFLTCSFLTRRGDRYMFSHRSFVEYLTAKALLEDMRDGNPSRFGQQLLTQEVIDFIVELNPATAALLGWIHATKFRGFETVRYLGSNAITVLNRLGQDLSGTDFSGTVLRGAKLRRGTFTNTIFAQADLGSCDLTESVIDGCNFDECDLTKAKFVSAQGRCASFKNAMLDHANFSKSVLPDADFSGSLCYAVDFEDALVDGARLTGFSLNGVSKTSLSLLLGLTDLTGNWYEVKSKRIKLDMKVNRRTGSLEGSLEIMQLTMTFDGVMSEGRYLLQGEEVEKRYAQQSPRHFMAEISCNILGYINLDITVGTLAGHHFQFHIPKN